MKSLLHLFHRGGELSFQILCLQPQTSNREAPIRETCLFFCLTGANLTRVSNI
jgi:hypothetical protein